jgi:hypothetical protein
MEKITLKYPVSLQPYDEIFIKHIAKSEQLEVCRHVAQMDPLKSGQLF